MLRMEISTSWVKPPPQIGGLDHLAVQAPCINIYGRLLPGITNVTDRARYYSFYPWLIWSFDRHGFTKYGDEFKERLRRADCLFTLVAAYHANKTGVDYEEHASAMVGSNTLAPVAKRLTNGGSLRLSDYSLRQGAKARYFKNPLGGLGQYYLGVMRELGILDGDAKNGVKYTRQIGQVIAEKMNEGLDNELFLSIVDSDNVTAEQLDTLLPACPCQLHNNLGEATLLVDLFFARGPFHSVEALRRRRSLQTILHLSTVLESGDTEISESAFRACNYSGGLPNGRQWMTPVSLVQERENWSIYARNELLSVAVQGLFYALLDGYEASGQRFHTSNQLVDWFIHTPEMKSVLAAIGASQSFSQVVESNAGQLPPLTNWAEPNHEIQYAEQVAQLCRNEPSIQNRRDIVLAALRVLFSLAHRFSSETNPYRDFGFEHGYFNYYPINLNSFRFHSTDTWSSMSVTEVLRWLFLYWCIDNHLRVALRKLRDHSQSTFRIRPSDQGLEVIAVPKAVHTRPRFNQVVRILKDLRVLTPTESGSWSPSEAGIDMMKLGDVP